MTKIQEIKAYKASDGTIFEGESDCIYYQRRIDARNWYENNKLYSDYSYADFDDLCEWMIEHREKVLELLEEAE